MPEEIMVAVLILYPQFDSKLPGNRRCLLKISEGSDRIIERTSWKKESCFFFQLWKSVMRTQQGKPGKMVKVSIKEVLNS